MKIVFAKLHCEHSDYLVANAKAPQGLSKPCARACNRRTGAGADGVAFVQKTGTEYTVKQLNPNGEPTKPCDAALRCVATFLSLQYKKATSFVINDSIFNPKPSGLIESFINNISLAPSDILPLKLNQALINSLCEIHGEGVRLSAVQCGIPYAIVLCSNLDYIDINVRGALFQGSRTFQNGINVAFIQIVNDACVKIKAYRYGCGQVPMCTNAAAAAAYVANYLSLCNKKITAVFENGAINVSLVNNNAVIMATSHYVGKFELEE